MGSYRGRYNLTEAELSQMLGGLARVHLGPENHPVRYESRMDASRSALGTLRRVSKGV